MYAKTETIKDLEGRMEIIKTNERWEYNSKDSMEEYAKTDREVFKLIVDSQERLKRITVSDDIYIKISEKCIEENVRGNAVDMTMCESVKAVAALHGREHIIEDDIEEASFFVLPHRRMFNQSEEQTENNKNDKGDDDKESNQNDRQDNTDENTKENTREHEEKDNKDSPNINAKSMSKGVEKTDEVGKAFNVINLSHSSDKKNRSQV